MPSSQWKLLVQFFFILFLKREKFHNITTICLVTPTTFCLRFTYISLYSQQYSLHALRYSTSHTFIDPHR